MVKNNNGDRSRRYSSFYSYTGDYATTRIARAIARKSWRWTLLNLAWTAGPVTILAIYIGHNFGFGSGPSPNHMIYFATYALVVGVLAVIAGIVREAFYQPKIENEKKQLLESIDRSFDLIFHIRDLNLASLPLKERKIMAAYYTLQSAGCSPSAVREAVYDLTSNEKLVHAIDRIGALSEQGMTSLMEEVWNRNQVYLQDTEEHLSEIAPAAYDLLVQRMKGNPPDGRSGRPRDEGFIQRALDAAYENDTDLMTLTDAYEIATLNFELLNGRKIALLEAHFTGDRKILKKKKRLDAAKKQYRDAIHARNSAIRLVLDTIDSEDLIDRLPETARSGPLIMRTMIEELRKIPFGERSRYHEAYNEILSLHKKASKTTQELISAKQHYLKAVEERGEKLSLKLKESDLKQAGFYIEKKFIELEDEKKLLLAHFIREVIGEQLQTIGEEKAKVITMELAATLDQLINIGHRDIQTAIESSYALQLGYLRPSYTPATKVGWATRVVESMHENSKRASHYLAKNLVTFYGISLSNAINELLVAEFGADPEFLLSLSGDRAEKSPVKELRISVPQDIPSWEEL